MGGHTGDPRRWRLRSVDGFTIIEVMMAMLVLTVGIIGLMATFDSARKLTLVSERRAAAAHRAQWEIEKLEAQPYGELAMIETPKHSSASTNPDYYVNYNSPVKCTEVEAHGCYAPNVEKAGEEEEPLVVVAQVCKGTEEEKCGIVLPSPEGHSCATNAIGSCEWKDGQVNGALYDFVTWHNDVVCKVEEKGKKVCSTQSDKRLTVIATVNVPAGSASHPQVRTATIVSDPHSVSEASPLENPTTKCGETKECITGIQQGNPQSWYLHDSYASSETPTAPSESHAVHTTIAATGECKSGKTAGCPVPDLMDSTHPTTTKLFDYSLNLDGEGFTLGAGERGGRLLRKEAECKGTPGNSGGEMWVTPKLGAATKLTGYGGLTLYTQTLNNVAAKVTLCIGVYDVPEAVPSSEAPKLIGVVNEYTPSSGTWPTTPVGGSLSGLSFVFAFLSEAQLKAGETVTVAEKHRIGLRIWPSSVSSTSSIGIAYDTTGTSEVVEGKTVEKPGYSSLVQLNTE